MDMQSTALKEYFNEFIRQWSAKNNECEPTQPLSDSEAGLEETNSKLEVKSEQPSFIYPEPFDLKTLEFMVNYVGSQLHWHGKEELIQDMIKQENTLLKHSTKQDNIALLEWFLKHQMGSCRHHALVVIYLLVTLIDCHAKQNDKDFSATGSMIYRFRTNLVPKKPDTKPGSHAVAIYEANGHRYLLDSSSLFNKKRIAINLTTMSNEEKQRFIRAYPSYDGRLLIKEINEIYHSIRDKNLSKSLSQTKPMSSSEKRSADSYDDSIDNHKKRKCGN